MTAFLRAASPALIAALAAGSLRYSANLFTITLIDGVTVFNWTDYDQNLTFGGTMFSSKIGTLSRPSWKVTNTMEVPQMSLKLTSINTAFNGGAGLELQIHSGLFDGAQLLLQRAMMGADANPNTLGVVPLFKGKISAIDLDGLTATIGVKGKLNDLDQYAPRNLYQPPCNRRFCDTGCTLNAATYTASFTVGTAPVPTFIPWNTAPANPTAYQNGTLVFTTGAASGSRRTIASSSTAGITLSYPLPFVPAPGDGFTALQGCDKTLNSSSNQSCNARSNALHFRGFPNVPPPASSY